MITPKFSIGDKVKSNDYAIRDATVVGILLYIEKNFMFKNIDNLDIAISAMNACDYDVIFIKDDKLTRDSCSEQYLELE